MFRNGILAASGRIFSIGASALNPRRGGGVDKSRVLGCGPVVEPFAPFGVAAHHCVDVVEQVALYEVAFLPGFTLITVDFSAAMVAPNRAWQVIATVRSRMCKLYNFLNIG